MSEERLQQRSLSKVRSGALANREKVPHRFLIILVLSLALFAAALSWLSVQYQTNDDAAMNIYAAGKALGQPPSEFLLFQHFTIGLALKFLYTHLPGIPWYGALMYAYLFLSSLVIGYAISRLNPRSSVLGLLITALILFYLPVILTPQFTLCSGYLALSGILLLYSIVYKPHVSEKANLSLLTIAAALLILAGLIRFYSLFLALLSMAPLYLHLLVTRFTMALRRLLPTLCCVVLISGLLNWGQKLYYEHSPGWERFYSYNNVRADFIDRHKIPWDSSTRPLFQQIGWSRNDLTMLTLWFYLDPKVYSFQNLLFISQHTSLLPPQEVAWAKLLADLKSSLLSDGGIATLLLCFLLLIKSARTVRGFAVLALFWYSTLFVTITVVERHLPIRVWLVMLFGTFLTEVVLWCDIREDQPVGQATNTAQILSKAILSFLVVAVYVTCCWSQIRAVNKLSNRYRYAHKHFRDELAQLQPRPDQLFVIWGGDFPFEAFQLPTQSEPVTDRLQLLGLGVGNHEPFVQNRLRSFGIDDLYQSFYTREDIFLICREEKKKLLVQYIYEHYQTRVEVETVFKGSTFTVRKVRKLI